MAIWTICDVADRYPHCVEPVDVSDEQALRDVMRRLAGLEPRVATIGVTENGSIQVGIGGGWAFIQHTIDAARDTAEIAKPKKHVVEPPETVWFLVGGDVSEIEAEFLMPTDEAIELLAEWFRTGERPKSVDWMP